MGLVIYSLILALMHFDIWKLKPVTDPILTRQDFALALGIKIIYFFEFLFIFCDFYGQGQLYSNADNFMKDSALLSEYGRSHPLEFF
jgi:hypothetical protein